MGKFNKSSDKFSGDKGQKKRPNYRKDKKTEKPKPVTKNTKAEKFQEQKRQEKLERDTKIALYKKKRQEKTKVVSKKTSRGQPLMKNRIEYLLKQIQESKRS